MSKSSLLWFIRSRSYVTVADLRRRFGIAGSDDVTAIVGPQGRVYVGLPSAQSDMLRDLWRDGKIGFELAMDIKAPTVTGVYGVFQRGERFERPPLENGEGEADEARTIG